MFVVSLFVCHYLRDVSKLLASRCHSRHETSQLCNHKPLSGSLGLKVSSALLIRVTNLSLDLGFQFFGKIWPIISYYVRIRGIKIWKHKTPRIFQYKTSSIFMKQFFFRNFSNESSGRPLLSIVACNAKISKLFR